MPQKVLIVEDNKTHMDALSQIIKSLSKELQVYFAYDTKQAFRIALEHHIHLFLIDIVLNVQKSGDVSGLNFAREIRGISKYKFTPLIFVTSLEDPRLYSYSQLHCYGYIEKPFSADQVKEVVSGALEFPVKEEEDKYAYFRKDGIVYSMCIKDIVYIESIRKKVTIYCINETLEIPYKTCEEMLHELDSDLFIQCSRYSIINKKYIKQIDYANRFVRLEYMDKPVEIGNIMKKSFKQRVENG